MSMYVCAPRVSAKSAALALKASSLFQPPRAPASDKAGLLSAKRSRYTKRAEAAAAVKSKSSLPEGIPSRVYGGKARTLPAPSMETQSKTLQTGIKQDKITPTRSRQTDKSNPPSSSTRQAASENTGQSGAITAHEVEQRVQEALGLLSGSTARAPDMIQLCQGSLGRGHGFEVYGSENEDGDLQLQFEATFHVPARMLYRCLTDEAYQESYDQYVKFKKVVQRVHGNEVIHHECAFPSPLSNRDYVYYRRKKIDLKAGYYFYMHRDLPVPLQLECRPLVKKVVRAGNGKYWQLCMVKEIDATQCQVMIRSQDNIEGSIPQFLRNFASKKAGPGYMKSMEKAAVSLMVEEGLCTKADAKKWNKL